MDMHVWCASGEQLLNWEVADGGVCLDRFGRHIALLSIKIRGEKKDLACLDMCVYV